MIQGSIRTPNRKLFRALAQASNARLPTFIGVDLANGPEMSMKWHLHVHGRVVVLSRDEVLAPDEVQLPEDKTDYAALDRAVREVASDALRAMQAQVDDAIMGQYRSAFGLTKPADWRDVKSGP